MALVASRAGVAVRDRLLEVNGDLPPNELEQAHYRQAPALTEVG
jgi:hypothetical protein